MSGDAIVWEFAARMMDMAVRYGITEQDPRWRFDVPLALWWGIQSAEGLHQTPPTGVVTIFGYRARVDRLLGDDEMRLVTA